MKSFLYFLSGLVVGVVLTILIAWVITKTYNSADNNPITMFEEVGDIITTNDIKLFQVVDDNAALAHEIGNYGIPTGLTVLYYSDEGSLYDGQTLKLKRNECFRQIGVYKYQSMNEVYRTVPIVTIFEK